MQQKYVCHARHDQNVAGGCTEFDRPARAEK